MRTDRAAILTTALLSTALGLLLLGPALLPGYVLAYDMVWVPDLAARPDFWGTGSALPRAVPADAVVAALDEVLPGSLLQKLVLLGSLVSAGTGCGRLLQGCGRGPMLVGATLAVWNPYVVERLWLGHWTMLLAYAVTPWILVLAARARRDQQIPALLPLLALLGSLSAGAGLMVGVAALAAGIAWSATGARLALIVAGANAPWIAAGLLHQAHATSSASAAEAFAARGEGALGLPLTILGLGGVWNSEVMPSSRATIAGALALLLLLSLVTAGARSWWRDPGDSGRRGPVLAAAVGWGLALLSGWQPEVLGWLASQVPGGGLIRDGSRLLGLAAPLLFMMAGHGTAVVLRIVKDPLVRPLVSATLCLGVMATLPDASWGGLGRLSAVSYPVAWEQARSEIGDAQGRDVLVLPFSSYRAPEWNQNRKVLDPLGRYLAADYVTSDALFVSGARIPGEDPRARRIGDALKSMTGSDLTALLTSEGVGIVVIDLAGGAVTPDFAEGGGVAVQVSEERFGDLVVVDLGEVTRHEPPESWLLVMGAAWAFWILAPVAACLSRRRRRDLRRTVGQ